ncbi:MAG: hypothetical protein PHQ52_07935 [Candidatus Omnitrophica bacterium]|nr:hypothetical protein [Candidatus Omnitrophota bacterium]
MKKFIQSFLAKPLGIKIISTLFFLIALFCSCFILTLAGITMLPLSIVFFSLAYGIYQKRLWAHAWTGVLMLAWLIVGIRATLFTYKGMVVDLFPDLAGYVVAILFSTIVFFIISTIPICVLFYLKNTKVKEEFK